MEEWSGAERSGEEELEERRRRGVEERSGAERSGVEWSSSHAGLHVLKSFLHWNCYIKDEVWLLRFARWNMCFFGFQRTFRCGEKLARLRDGCGRNCFSVESLLICARTASEVSRCCFCLLLLTLCYCLLQLHLNRSQWSGCVKVPQEVYILVLE